MTSDWQTIDWDQAKPDRTAIAASHRNVEYAPINPALIRTRAVTELLDALNAVHTNGAALLGGFEVAADDPTVRWYAARNRFGEYGFFAHFLASAPVRAALPELHIPEHLDDLELDPSWTNALGLDAEWAATLVHGGAYHSYADRQPEAKRLGSAAATSLIGDRYADFVLFTTGADWTDWFQAVAWDHTWLLIDKANTRLYLLCVTDTD